MFRDFPVSRSTRAARMWTWTPPPGSSCRTADQAYRSGSRPAQARRSKSSRTSFISFPVGLSSGAQAITADVCRCLKSRESAIAPTSFGSPRSTSTPARVRPLWSFSSSRYSADAPPEAPVLWNLNIIGWHQIFQCTLDTDEVFQQAQRVRPLLPVGGPGKLVEIIPVARNRGQ